MAYIKNLAAILNHFPGAAILVGGGGGDQYEEDYSQIEQFIKPI